MAAAPADIAKYTVDGVVITSENTGLKATHPDAIDLGDQEVEMFFTNPSHAQTFLDEKLTLRSKVDPVHVAVEVEDSLALGTTTAISPSVPCFRYIDEDNEQDVVARTRAFAYESNSDRYSVELLE